MPKFYSTLLLSSAFALLTLNSIAQEATLLQNYSSNQVDAILDQIGVPDGAVNPQYEVEFYKINYRTLHPNGDSVDVTGALCIPAELDCPLPLASYQHGTVALKTNVPSYQNGESQIGVILASVGYAVAMPDYIGLGDSEGLHPYVHAESQATTSLNLLRAVKDLQNELGFSLGEQLFLCGYSQGGHATMALHEKIQEEASDEFTVTAAAPMSGPYDISGIQAEVLTSEEPYPTPGYMPYVLLSYQLVYGTLYDELEDIFLPEYAAIIPDLFDGSNSIGFINNQFPSVPSAALLPEVFEAYLNDPEHPIRVAMQDNNLYDWVPQAPTRLFGCNADDQVAWENSTFTAEWMSANGAPDVEAIDGGDFNHEGCAPLAILAGFLFFEQYREVFEPEVDVLILDASGAEAPDGSVSVTVNDPEPDWVFSWEDGTEGLELTDVTPGNYTLTITDPDGCSFDVEVMVGNATTIAEQSRQKLKVWPQPADHAIHLESHRFKHIALMALTGEVVAETKAQGQQTLDVKTLQAGVYILVADNVIRRKVVIH